MIQLKLLFNIFRIRGERDKEQPLLVLQLCEKGWISSFFFPEASVKAGETSNILPRCLIPFHSDLSLWIDLWKWEECFFF